MRPCKSCRLSVLLLAVSVLLQIWACSSVPVVHDENPGDLPDSLVLTFAGDIMAHNVNFNMRDYNKIYKDVRTILHEDDLSFANFETPVADTLPMSTYPRFNVHNTYLEAAVAGGFDVFSLANNHTNDHGFPGMKGTLAAVERLPHGIYANGIHKAVGDPMVPVVLEKKGWTIVFLAVTEILNSRDPSAAQIYYSPPDSAGRKKLRTLVEKIAAEYPHALFILSLHTNEPEYVRTVRPELKQWFTKLAQSGVDILWAHHPHVMQEWETVHIHGKDRLFMYSMGNFISGQRWRMNLDDPGASREYTGDAVLLQVTLNKFPGTGSMISPVITPIPITNYLDPQHGMVVRLFNAAFVESLSEPLQSYYRTRYALMTDYLPLLPSMP